MDLLDSSDMGCSVNRAHRVRSWYLYEQYKTLEENQLDAVRKLKNRSSQDKILHQELCERRARRKLFNKVGRCQSDCRISNSMESAKSICSNDLSRDIWGFDIDSYMMDEEELKIDKELLNCDERDIQCYQTLECPIPGDRDFVFPIKCNTDSFNSNKTVVVERDIQEEINETKQTIAENINMQLENAKENLNFLEKFSKVFDEEDEINYVENVELYNNFKLGKLNEIEHKGLDEIEDVAIHKDCLGILSIWSKMVSFAYQVIQLNHGNCYYDYSLQLMTTVLLCDILCKGLAKISYILQPYVTPIKFYEDETKIYKIEKLNKKRTTFTPRSEPVHRNKAKFNERQRFSLNYLETCRSENTAMHFKKVLAQPSGYSEPLRSSNGISMKDYVKSDLSTNSTLWPKSESEHWTCPCCTPKVNNPINKLLDTIDKIIELADDFSKPVL